MRRSRMVSQFLLDIFYPNRCPCCQAYIPWNAYLCPSCQQAVFLPPDSFCPGCGKPSGGCLCGTGLAYDQAVVLTSYGGMGRAGILSLKAADSLNFAYACGEVFSQRIVEREELLGCDLLVPVPMERRKKRVRRINPPEVVCREIVRQTNIPMQPDLLKHTGKGETQHLLTAAERMQNTARFCGTGADLTGYRILLCDDVLTTGSTMHSCARLLKDMGAAQVIALAIATTA